MTSLRVLTLPNILTIFRIVSVLPMIGLIMINQPWSWVSALILFILSAISDFLDGYLARRLNQYSELGRVLDPIADKIVIGALFPVLAGIIDLGNLDLLAISIIMIREFLISGLRESLATKNVTLHVSKLAKWKTTIQLIAICLIISAVIYPELSIYADIVLYIAAMLTALTGIQYIRNVMTYII